MSGSLSRHFKNALVTGASSGLGRAFAAELVREGVVVWGTSRAPARIAAPIRGVRFDLADGAQGASELFRQVGAESGGIDLVVHNAGAGVFGRFSSTEFELWERQIRDLALAGAAVLHSAMQHMESREHGTIVCVSSIAAEFPIPFMAGYNAAKSAQSALAESLMLETAGTGINVIDFRAGDYRTGFNEAMTRNVDPTTEAAWKQSEAHLRSAPTAGRAAADLLRALQMGRSGIVRSGSFFQTTIAPTLARLAPRSWQLALIRRYYGIS